jgi:3-methyladenine DNA glycosylase Tag
MNSKRQRLSDIPAETAESQAMSKDLKKRGFRFVGSTICYAFMQAVGMVQPRTRPGQPWKTKCPRTRRGHLIEVRSRV